MWLYCVKVGLMSSEPTNRKRERDEEALVTSMHEKPSDSRKQKGGGDEEKGKRWTPDQVGCERDRLETMQGRNLTVRVCVMYRTRRCDERWTSLDKRTGRCVCWW